MFPRGKGHFWGILGEAGYARRSTRTRSNSQGGKTRGDADCSPPLLWPFVARTVVVVVNAKTKVATSQKSASALR